MDVAKCVVSFVDSIGIKHSVTVHAESVCEAAGLAVVAFNSKDHMDWLAPPGAGTRFEVEMHPPLVTHTVTLERVNAWLSSSGSPSETASKHRIRQTLEVQRK